MKLGSEFDGCTWDGCCSVDVVVFVIVVRMVVVLWDGFRYASYLSVVCLEPFPALQQDIHLLLSCIHAYPICNSTWGDVCVSGINCERCMNWECLVGVIEVRMLMMVL